MRARSSAQLYLFPFAPPPPAAGAAELRAAELTAQLLRKFGPSLDDEEGQARRRDRSHAAELAAALRIQHPPPSRTLTK
jgi:hypothetical protein